MVMACVLGVCSAVMVMMTAVMAQMRKIAVSTHLRLVVSVMSYHYRRTGWSWDKIIA